MASALEHFSPSPRPFPHLGTWNMTLLLIILLVVLLLGGGGFYGRRAGWRPRNYTGLLVTILLIVLLVWVVNELLLPTPPIPAGTPPITR
jgi:hypothetical protein